MKKLINKKYDYHFIERRFSKQGNEGAKKALKEIILIRLLN